MLEKAPVKRVDTYWVCKLRAELWLFLKLVILGPGRLETGSLGNAGSAQIGIQRRP